MSRERMAQIIDLAEQRRRRTSARIADVATLPLRISAIYAEAAHRATIDAALEMQRANERALVEAGYMPPDAYMQRWGG